MADFALDISKFVSKTKDKLNVVPRKLFLDISARIIMRSPVRTGRFRNAWQFGRNQKPTGVIEGVDAGSVNQTGVGSSTAKDRVESGIAGFQAGDTMYLTNNLPYAERLEDRWSPQASGGIVGITLTEMEVMLNKIGAEIIKT